MIEQIDGWYVAAQIRLTRQVHKGSILLLEGDTDAKVFGRFIDRASCEIEISYGKPNAIKALDLLEDEGFPGVVAVTDSDFDRIRETQYMLENLCLTDLHDLDLTIFASPAFDHFIGEYADEDLLTKGFAGDFSFVRKKIIEASLAFAYCRFVSECRDLRLYFKGLRHDQFVDVNSLSVNTEALMEGLVARSSTGCTIASLADHFAREVNSCHDPYQLSNGHDVAAILGIGLRRLLATRRENQTWAKEIEAGLRLAYDWEAFIGSSLYRCLRRWERNNAPYRIFRQVPG